jgi:hypothetical protein
MIFVFNNLLFCFFRIINLDINSIQVFIIQSMSKFLLRIIFLGVYLLKLFITILIDSSKLSENSPILFFSSLLNSLNIQISLIIIGKSHNAASKAAKH